MARIRDMEMINFWPDPDHIPERVVVAMSGGVDSTFAAWWLQRAGLEVIGVHFQLGEFGPGKPSDPRCCSPRDERDARLVANLLDIPYYVIPLADRFEEEVIHPFARAYGDGLTPNPCIQCNPRIKWRTLIGLARDLGAPAVATGHHARVTIHPYSGKARLSKGISADKDQSYFLARLEAGQLAQAVLPAGWFTKARVRQALAEAGLAVAGKAESQEICFTGPHGYANMVEKVLGPDAPASGEIVDLTGRIMGIHHGIHHFTVGQRRGLGISGPEPYYVVDVDPIHHRIVIGPKQSAETDRALLQDLHWIHEPPAPHENLTIKVRYQARPVPCRLLLADGQARIILASPTAIAPGQAGVIYRREEVLGGGFFVRIGDGCYRRCLPKPNPAGGNS
jgi:tRNA-specific 2-thiouridylase